MKKRYMVTFASLIIGIVMLTTAVFANASNITAYTAYKDAGKRLIFTNNYTLELSSISEINGEIVRSFQTSQKYTDGDESTITKELDSNFEYENEKYIQDNKYVIMKHSYPGMSKQDDLYTAREISKYDIKENFFGIDPNNTEQVEQYIKFVELVGDALIGDIRNNFTMTDIGDGTKQVDLTLSGPQVPEIINLGFSLVAGRNHGIVSYDNNNNSMTEDVSITSVIFTGTIDKDGNLCSGLMVLEATGKDSGGNENNMTVTIDIKVSDIGSTVPDRIDINRSDVYFLQEKKGNDDILDTPREAKTEDSEKILKN